MTFALEVPKEGLAPELASAAATAAAYSAAAASSHSSPALLSWQERLVG